MSLIFLIIKRHFVKINNTLKKLNNKKFEYDTYIY